MDKGKRKIKLIKEILLARPGLTVNEIIQEMTTRDDHIFDGVESRYNNNIWGLLETVTEGHSSYKGIPHFVKDGESRFSVYDKENKTLYFKSDYTSGIGNTEKGKKISITQRDKNISANHEKMKKTIALYAEANNLPFKAEEPIDRYSIDVYFRDDIKKEIFIGEVKSYENGFYGGVGQLLMYELLTKRKFPGYKIKLGYISKETLKDTQVSLLNNYNISHIKMKGQINKIWN